MQRTFGLSVFLTLALLFPMIAAAQSSEAQSSGAQSSGAKRFGAQVDLSVVRGIPQGKLGENVSGGVGASVAWADWTGPASLVRIGLDGTLLTYGENTETVPFNRLIGPRVPVEVSTSNNVAQAHLSFRIQPQSGRFRPYGEVLGGIKYFFTQTSVSSVSLTDRELASAVNQEDVALSGGIGGGIDIDLFNLKGAGDVQRMGLHLGVEYLWGGEASYLDQGPLADENGNGRLDAKELGRQRSPTTLLQVEVGIVLRLGK